jgi:hypothetical protein
LKAQAVNALLPKPEQYDVVVLQDKEIDVSANMLQDRHTGTCSFLKFGRVWHPDVHVGFVLQQGEHELELVLHDDPALARPRRGHFPVADLRLNDPVLVSLNHKSDFSMSGRRARTYWYEQFLFTYIGECTSVNLSDEDSLWVKPVPWRSARHVELNKRLL